MRITYYAKVTPQLFNARGKDVYRALNCLRNFVSQANRSGAMNLVFTKNEDNVNEIFASLRNTNFNDFITEEDESEFESD